MTVKDKDYSRYETYILLEWIASIGKKCDKITEHINNIKDEVNSRKLRCYYMWDCSNVEQVWDSDLNCFTCGDVETGKYCTMSHPVKIV